MNLFSDNHAAVCRNTMAIGVIAIFLIGAEARADLSEKMQEVFEESYNSTSSSYYETARRGVIGGGSIVSRARVMNEDLVTFAPPSAEAGCSGIDLFSGSIGFINKDRFVKLLRAIAANAKGYAFQIALSAMCEKCSQYMETLQRKVQQLNQYFGNSCQLAQGIVNDSLSAFGAKGLTDASLKSVASGAADLFDSWTSDGGVSPYERASEADSTAPNDKNSLTGNILYLALRDSGAASWFGESEKSFLEELMSVSGTIIVSRSGSDVSVSLLPGGLVDVRALVFGGEAGVYSCISKDCSSVSVSSKNYRGLAQRIYEMLCGADGASGIIGKFAKNEGPLSSSEKFFLERIGGGAAGMIRNLSVANQESARLFASRLSPFIALSLAKVLMKDLMRAAEVAAGSSGNAYAPMLAKSIERAAFGLEEEHAWHAARYGNESDIAAYYESLMRSAGAADYGADVR